METQKEKNSFVMYYEWEESFSDLTNAQLGELLRAIFAYEKRGESYSGNDPSVKMAMGFIKGALDRGKERYQNVCERNRANGKKGGRPLKSGQADASFSTALSTNLGGIKNPVGSTETQKTQWVFQKPKKPDNEQNRTEHEHERDREHEHEHDASASGGSGSVGFDASVLVRRLESAGIRVSEADKATMEDWMTKYGVEYVECAVNEGIERKARKFGYISGIVRNWLSMGLDDGGKVATYKAQTDRRKKAPNAPCPAPAPIPVDLAQEAAESAARAEQLRALLQGLQLDDEAGVSHPDWDSPAAP